MAGTIHELWQIQEHSASMLAAFKSTVPAPIWCSIGIACAIASAASTVVGMLLQKQGQKRDSRPVFLLGVFIFTAVKPVTQIAALYFAPLMLIAPMASVTILLNAVIVPYCQDVRLTWVDLLIGLVLVLGCVATSVAGSHSSPSWSYHELVILASRRSWLTSILLACLFAISAALKFARTRLSSMPLGIVVIALAPSIASALNNVMLKAFLNGATSAPPQALFLLAVAIFTTAFLQVWTTTVSVQLFDMLAFVPVQISEQILVTTLYGIAFYEEIPSNNVVFASGCMAILVGVFMSQYHRSESVDEYVEIGDGLTVGSITRQLSHMSVQAQCATKQNTTVAPESQGSTRCSEQRPSCADEGTPKDMVGP